ncbi:MAG: glycosyl transferase [Bacteroidetes bacterium]|nr:glycosyl transferase [Bacteroidota bacterium]MCW5894885.1 glycosyl transferase [Bacteroidota bacterium]
MNSRIPNQFHFVFVKQSEPFHLAFYLCIESCLQVNKPDKIFFHFLKRPYGRLWDSIKERITPVQLDGAAYRAREESVKKKIPGSWSRKFSYAIVSDFIRLEKLVEYGGIYADVDTLFVNPLPERLMQKPFVLGREPDFRDETTNESRPSICSAIIMSEPQAEFGRSWLREMETAFDGSWNKHSSLLPYQLSLKYPDLVHIEPQRSFFHHDYTPAGINALFKKCDADFSGMYSMHLWSNIWWSRWRRDFWNFHSGKLTPRYIRNVDTTYNILARRYLPDA